MWHKQIFISTTLFSSIASTAPHTLFRMVCSLPSFTSMWYVHGMTAPPPGRCCTGHGGKLLQNVQSVHWWCWQTVNMVLKILSISSNTFSVIWNWTVQNNRNKQFDLTRLNWVEYLLSTTSASTESRTDDPESKSLLKFIASSVASSVFLSYVFSFFF